MVWCISRSDKNEFVVKADGLVAGKGVVVCTSKEETLKAINEVNEKFCKKSTKLIIEEVLRGPEISVSITYFFFILYISSMHAMVLNDDH